MVKKPSPDNGDTDSSVHETPPGQELTGSAAPSPHVTTAETLSPDAWAEILYPPSPSGRLHDDAWKHASADVLHGWSAYVSRTGSKPALNKFTYEAAIAAASGNTFIPFPAADYRTRG